MPMFKRQAAVLLALTALALGVVFYLWPENDPVASMGKPVAMDGRSVQMERNSEAASRESGSDKAMKKTVTDSAGLAPGGRLTVFVSGAVKQPGVFELPAGSRIEDAVKAAGGFGALADNQKLNLAQPLKDGEAILVPHRSAGQVNDSGAAGADRPAVKTAASSLVRLNSATAAELETLPGIGPALAGRIIEHRNRHGAFRRIEDVQEVPGIGAGRFERMKDRLAL